MRVESEHMGLGTHEHFLGVADELADRLGAARAVRDRGLSCGCQRGSQGACAH